MHSGLFAERYNFFSLKLKDEEERGEELFELSKEW
jgi:hypothetical protein